MEAYRIQPLDHHLKEKISFDRAELKRLYNALILVHISNGLEILPCEQLLQKLKYYIEENGKS